MKEVIKSIFQYVGAILLAIVIAALLRFFIVDFYSIPSDSMYPTIEPGDFIVVNKMYMGARFYKNFDFLDGAHPETVRTPGFSSLKRNDVIVFNFPTHTNGRWDMDLGTFYVKRCIALPGDTLSIIKGINHVNGKTGFGNVEEQQRLHHYHGEYAPGIYNAFPFDYWHRWNIQDFGPLYLPAAGKNWYFVAGDQVFNSRDSRYIGPIPEDFIVGKASFILTSKDPHTKKYVWQRFFKKIK